MSLPYWCNLMSPYFNISLGSTSTLYDLAQHVTDSLRVLFFIQESYLMIESDLLHIFSLSQDQSELVMRVFLFVTKSFFILIFFEKLNVNAFVDVIKRRRLILLCCFGIISILDRHITFFSSTLLLIFTISRGSCCLWYFSIFLFNLNYKFYATNFIHLY